METLTINVTEIIKVLVNDGNLCQGRNEFVDLLQIEVATRQQLDNLYIQTVINASTYYNRIFQAWVGSLGNNATLDKLCTYLEQGNFISVADSLRSRFPTGTGIIVMSPSAASINAKNQNHDNMSALHLSEQKIRTKAASLLSKDATFVLNWEQFNAFLGNPTADAVPLKLHYNSGQLTNYSLMERILSAWGSRESGSANIGKLCEILKEMDRGTLAVVGTNSINVDSTESDRCTIQMDATVYSYVNKYFNTY